VLGLWRGLLLLLLLQLPGLALDFVATCARDMRLFYGNHSGCMQNPQRIPPVQKQPAIFFTTSTSSSETACPMSYICKQDRDVRSLGLIGRTGSSITWWPHRGGNFTRAACVPWVVKSPPAPRRPSAHPAPKGL
jgi:hypothetical protein